jgi:hypothetical protein
MIKSWFQDIANWFKSCWLDWVILVVYVGFLYWTAAQNWQVTHFPPFIVAFILLTFGLVITYRYIRSKV